MAERKKLDLRSRAPTPPPPAAPTDTAMDMLGPGMLKPGQVLDQRYMTPWEKQQLEAIGWDPGTPVPGNASELIAAARSEATAAGILPVPADTPPLEVPKPVDIGRLPAAKQQELREALKKAGQFQQQLIKEGEAAANMNPSIAAAMEVANDVARQSQRSPGITVVDDRPFRAPIGKGKPAPAAGIPASPKQMGWARASSAAAAPTAPPFTPPPSAQEPQPPEPPPDGDPPIGELSSTGAVGITHCPHCSWELKRPDPSEPTDDDKRSYLMAALGGPGHRFARETMLLGGTIKVGYRELTGAEADAALTQIASDVRSGRVVGDGEWWQRLMDYRMTQAVDYIEIQGVGRVHEGVDLDDIESDDGHMTPYPALVSHLLANVLHAESIRRAVGQGYMRFQRLCEKLEANAETESFWPGIGSLR
jgi:hypothetical protein